MQKDNKTLNLILNQMHLYKENKIDLSELVINLEALFNSLEISDKKWEDEFLNEFSLLESMNAETPNMKQSEINKLINNAISTLEGITKQKIY